MDATLAIDTVTGIDVDININIGIGIDIDFDVDLVLVLTRSLHTSMRGSTKNSRQLVWRICAPFSCLLLFSVRKRNIDR